MTDAVIVSTARTPIGKAYKGALNHTEGATLLGHAISSALSRARIEGAEVEDVALAEAGLRSSPSSSGPENTTSRPAPTMAPKAPPRPTGAERVGHHDRREQQPQERVLLRPPAHRVGVGARARAARRAAPRCCAAGRPSSSPRLGTTHRRRPVARRASRCCTAGAPPCPGARPPRTGAGARRRPRRASPRPSPTRARRGSR